METNSVEPRTSNAPLSPEWQTGYQRVIEQAKQALGIRHLGLITPIRSLPSDSNTGIGSLSGAKAFFQFIAQLGFDTVQVDPEGKTKLADPSPYTGTIFSSNPLYIDLKDLIENPAWDGLLSRERLAAIEQGNPEQDGAKVAYTYIYTAQDAVLREVYETFQAKLKAAEALPAEEASVIRAIQARFAEFAQQNKLWLEPDALYEALSVEYGNDYWPNWKGPQAELDRNLYNAHSEAVAEVSQQRMAELKAKHQSLIGAYEFAQFILNEQKQVFKDFSARTGFKVMADRQVGFSDRDVWTYQKLFLQGWAMGCPPDYFSDNGQAWGFPVLDPERLFNADGSLGEGGELLKHLFEKIFEENPGGVRIDHIIGLIDPWAYPAGMRHTKDGGRLYSSPEHEQLGRFAFVRTEDLNYEVKSDDEHRVKDEAMTDEVVARYGRIVERIVLAAAQAKGIPMSSVICEDLGTLTTPVRHVLKKLDLSGIRVTQFSDPLNPEDIFHGCNVAARYWITPGSHDNEPLLRWSRSLVKAGKKEDPTVWRHAEWLTEALVRNPEQKDAYRNELGSNPLALTRAKLVELFASPAQQVQLFFADLFGMEAVYNRPGTTGNGNWSLRVPKNFAQDYLSALKEGRGLNLPEILKLTLEATVDHPDAQLLSELQRFADSLKAD